MHFITFVVLYLFYADISNSLHTTVCIGGYDDQPLGLMETRCNEIAEEYPGTKVEYINLKSAMNDGKPLLIQINAFIERVEQIAEENPDGINLVGYSLGGIFARAYIILLSKLKVLTLVSVNSPILGVYPYGPSPNLWSFTENLIFWNIITPLIESFKLLISGSSSSAKRDIWHDPRRETSFDTDFQPWLNNLNNTCSECRSNFLKVGNIYLVGSESDGVVRPWYATHGGFYDENFKMVPLEQQLIYRSNTLGWKTLTEQGRLQKLTIPNAGHADVILYRKLFEKYITKYLQ